MLTRLSAACVFAAALTASACAAQQVAAPRSINDAPLTERWAPSEWGAADRVGALNRITPERVLEATRLVRRGKVATLGRVYSSNMPGVGGRTWDFRITNFDPGPGYGPQGVVTLDDHVDTNIGQIGTQFDGPGHVGVQTSQGYYFYNGQFLNDEGRSEQGLGELGVENVAERGFVCRGVLLDAVALRGGALPVPTRASPDDPGFVSPRDIDAMIARQGIAPIREGDCVFLYTGHGDLWDQRQWDSFDDAERARRTAEFLRGAPGFGAAACEYLAARRIVLTGADTWPTEGQTPQFLGERGLAAECHVGLQTRHGIWNVENLDLSQLVADEAYEFLFVWSPLKIRGGTGSPGNPVALY